MTARISIRDQLARGWYELDPATVDGIELPFEDAPPVKLEYCYRRAAETLAVLEKEHNQRAA